MRRLVLPGILATLFGLMLDGAQVQSAPPTDADHSAAEESIRATVAAFTKAFDGGDAKAVAALFTSEAEIIDESGNIYKGTAAIERGFASQFKAQPDAKIRIQIQSIRLLSPDVAVEEGESAIVADDKPGVPSRYTVTYVRQGVRWLMSSARDEADDESNAVAELEQLGWLVGDWVDESMSGTVKTSYRWTDNRKFLLGDFTMNTAGRPVMSGSHRIGWDPMAKQLRSWLFDSEGGFSQGLWSRSGDVWVVKMSGVTRRSQQGSATNIYRKLADDRFSFESRDRTLGNQNLPAVAPVVVTRHPPEPGK